MVGSASALAILAGWNASNVGGVADPLAAAYGVGLPTVGVLITALLVVHSLAQIPAGGWTDRLGARRAGLLAVGILLVCNLAACAAPTFGLALAARTCMGLGTALAFLAGSSFLRLAGDSSLAQGWLGGMGIGGGGLAIAIVPRAVPVLSWRAPYATALVVCLLALGCLALAPSTRPTAGTPATGLRALVSLGNPLLRRLAVIHMGSMGVGMVASSWAVPFLTRKGYGLGQASLAASLILLGGFVSRPLGGWLQRRRPDWTRGLVLCSVGLSAVGMVLLVGPGGLSLPVLGSALLGLATGLPFGLVFNEAAVARPERPTAAVGFVNMFGNVGVVVATPLLGLAFLLKGGAGAGLLALAGLGLASALVLPGLAVPAAPEEREPAGLRWR